MNEVVYDQTDQELWSLILKSHYAFNKFKTPYYSYNKEL